MTDPIYLYLLMRTDLASMNPGKAVAQGAHAASKFVAETMTREADPAYQDFREWIESADGFGTKIALGVKERELLRTHDTANRMGFASGLVVDPSYPYVVDEEIVQLIRHPVDYPPVLLEDGKFLCHRQEVTCGYVFGRKDALSPILSKFSLMA